MGDDFIKDEGDANEFLEGDENGAQDKKVFLENISGVVHRTHRFGVYVAFDHEGKADTAVLFPGKSYVNCSKLLGAVVRSEQELMELFPVGMMVNMDLISQTSRLVPEASKVTGELRAAERTEERRCSWVVTLLWFGDVSCKPAKSSFNDGTLFPLEDQAFEARMTEASEKAFSIDNKPSVIKQHEDTWFVVTLIKQRDNTTVDHPDKAAVMGCQGTIVSINRPHGGVVKCGGTEVFFHRCRVYINGEHLAVTEDLLESLSIGLEVTVDYSPNLITKEGETENDESGQVIFENLPNGISNIALMMYVGERPKVSELCHKPFPFAVDESKFLIAQVVSLDQPVQREDGSLGGYESGIAKILHPTEQNTISFTKYAYKRFIDLGSRVRYVTFNREQMFHLGTMLSKADISFFFTPMYGMNIFYCYAEPIPDELPKVIYEGQPVTHRVNLGWKGSISFLHSTGQGGLSLSPRSREDTLFFPRIVSFTSTKFIGREGLDIKTYEDVLEGRIPSRAGHMNGYADAAGGKDYHAARVLDLLKPEGNLVGVSAGVVLLDSGPNAGEKAFFNRANCYCYGFKLDKSDLQFFMEPNEPCFVSIEKVKMSEVSDVQLEATTLWIGWPPEHGTFTSLNEISPKDRHKMLVYLEIHGLTLPLFLDLLKGTKEPRKYIPFRREELKGTVIQLERDWKPPSRHNHNGAPNIHFRDPGAVCGVIRVDRGTLLGKLVTFHRRNTWVLGYNMGKSDLTNIFIEGQKVSLEAVPITSEDRSKYRGLPFRYNFKATIVWTSKFRPRNDVEKTVPESVHVNNWLKKRGLTWDKFQLLVKGKMGAVPLDVAGKSKSNMLRGGELEMFLQSKESGVPVAANLPHGPQMPMEPNMRLETLPVFRHGEEAVRICDDALSAFGPEDPVIMRIIRNDQNAQMAFHIHKALGYALEVYKKKAGRSDSYSGFGDVFGSNDALASMHGSQMMRSMESGNLFQSQTNQMANRLQKMAMKDSEHGRFMSQGFAVRKSDGYGGHGSMRSSHYMDSRFQQDSRMGGGMPWGGGPGINSGPPEWGQGGVKRQLNNQGGSGGGKKNRFGSHR